MPTFCSKEQSLLPIDDDGHMAINGYQIDELLIVQSYK
jgi:hypothetical protein